MKIHVPYFASLPERAAALAGLFGLLTAACVLGPQYRRPSAPIPAAYKEEATAPETKPSDWEAARPMDDSLRGTWWEVFGDSELNALEERGFFDRGRWRLLLNGESFKQWCARPFLLSEERTSKVDLCAVRGHSRACERRSRPDDLI